MDKASVFTIVTSEAIVIQLSPSCKAFLWGIFLEESTFLVVFEACKWYNEVLDNILL
jgi:hypothetical protein